MIAAAGTKFFTTRAIMLMKRQIGQQQQVEGEVKTRLKGAQNKKKVLEQNRNTLSKKRTKLSNRLEELQNQLNLLEKEDAERLEDKDPNEN